jgi:hypothetical protein
MGCVSSICDFRLELNRLIQQQLLLHFVTGLWGSSTYGSKVLSSNSAAGAIKFFGDREVFGCG